jgi:hypothetical protein
MSEATILGIAQIIGAIRGVAGDGTQFSENEDQREIAVYQGVDGFQRI